MNPFAKILIWGLVSCLLSGFTGYCIGFEQGQEWKPLPTCGGRGGSAAAVGDGSYAIGGAGGGCPDDR